MLEAEEGVAVAVAVAAIEAIEAVAAAVAAAIEAVIAQEYLDIGENKSIM